MIHDALCQRPPVAQGPIPSPDYTMRTGHGHEPLPDRNSTRVEQIARLRALLARLEAEEVSS